MRGDADQGHGGGTPDPAGGSREMSDEQNARYVRWWWEVAGRPEPFSRWLWDDLLGGRDALAWVVARGAQGDRDVLAWLQQRGLQDDRGAELLAELDRLLGRIAPTVAGLTSDILPPLPDPEDEGAER